ncbi:MAG: hypothetical protein ACRDSI_02895 [Pseudonocardiaceae bacterium]
MTAATAVGPVRGDAAWRGPRLSVEDGRLRWRHALTRDAVLATLLPPERAALAARARRAGGARGPGRGRRAVRRGRGPPARRRGSRRARPR